MTITGLRRADHLDADDAILGSVGYARSGVDVAVLRDDDTPASAGEIGEIVCRGDVVMAGYWNNPDATGGDASGRLAAHRRHGVVRRAGFPDAARPFQGCRDQRWKQHLSSRGRRDPARASRRRRGRGWSARPTRSGARSSSRSSSARRRQPSWTRICLERIARFKRPKRYEFIDELPKNSYGKVLKRELRARLTRIARAGPTPQVGERRSTRHAAISGHFTSARARKWLSVVWRHARRHRRWTRPDRPDPRTVAHTARRLGRRLHPKPGRTAADLEAAGAEPVVIDLESASVDEVATHLRGADAVVFAAGAGPGSGAARKETVDRDAAILLADAAEAAQVGRYVMISAMGADIEAPTRPAIRSSSPTCARKALRTTTSGRGRRLTGRSFGRVISSTIRGRGGSRSRRRPAAATSP